MTSSAVTASSLLELFHRRDPEVEQRIEDGIARRRGAGRFRFVDEQGHPVKGVKISARLLRHEFLFGANAFMVEGFDMAEKNVRYEQAFSEVFNSAVVPFFWQELEPEPGRYRFVRGSEKIHRRPPPDVVLEFCRRHRLTPKGHCLVWHQIMPKWLSENPVEAARCIRRRIESIGERYGTQIALWDAVNEAMERYMFPQVKSLTTDYVFEAFEAAAKSFPSSARLILNEATVFSWREFHGTTTGLDLLAQNLRQRGARVGGLGLQYHLFFYGKDGLSKDLRMLADARDLYLDPKRLLAILDQHASLGLPLQISEQTLPCYEQLPDGEEFQAQLLRELYRLWFSHPAVDGIYAWNLADGCAYGSEGQLRAGLLREDLSEKPAYRALRQLVREEWSTSFTKTATEATLDFSGFYGTYELVVEHGGRRRICEITFNRQHEADFVVTVGSTAEHKSMSRARAEAVAG